MATSVPPKAFILKMVVVGNGSVGKTSLVLQYCEKKFSENYIMTIGSNFAIKSLSLDSTTNVKLQIWDLAGQQHFSFVRPPFYRGASGTVYVFDITNRDSFENILEWKREVETVVQSKPSVLVGNKCDLADERVVSKKEGELLAEKIGPTCLGYYETSAKTGINLDDMFHKLVHTVIDKK
jgi:small GTP-binding protein